MCVGGVGGCLRVYTRLSLSLCLLGETGKIVDSENA